MKTNVALIVTVLGWTVCVQQAAGQTQPPKALFFPSNKLLPDRGLYVAPPQTSIGSTNGVMISNLVLRAFSESVPAPPPGTSVALTFAAEADFDLSLNGGGGVSRISLPVELTLNVSAGSTPTGGPAYVTSILEFKPLGKLPGILAFRQSPNRASAGQAAITPVAGGFLISGFFDVFLDSSTGWGPELAAAEPGAAPGFKSGPVSSRGRDAGGRACAAHSRAGRSVPRAGGAGRLLRRRHSNQVIAPNLVFRRHGWRGTGARHVGHNALLFDPGF